MNSIKTSKAYTSNCNFLDRPTFLPSVSLAKSKFYTDDNGFTAKTSSDSLPVLLDQKFLLLMTANVQHCPNSSNPNWFEFKSVYQIAKALHYKSINPRFAKRYLLCLDRWKGVNYIFDNYYESKGVRHIKSFGVIDDYELLITKGNNISGIVSFNKEWLNANLENHSRKITLKKLLMLQSGTSARLFEILTKNFKGRSQWPIGQLKLSKKLGITVGKQKQSVNNLLQQSLMEINNASVKLNSEEFFYMKKVQQTDGVGYIFTKQAE
jgi:hypothetical protein